MVLFNFPLSTGNILFEHIWFKYSKLSVEMSYPDQLENYAELNGDIHFSVYQFWGNLGQKIEIVILGLNLAPRLIRICRIQWCCSLFPFSTCNICSDNPFGILQFTSRDLKPVGFLVLDYFNPLIVDV